MPIDGLKGFHKRLLGHIVHPIWLHTKRTHKRPDPNMMLVHQRLELVETIPGIFHSGGYCREQHH